nr:uncharacterized protein LOC117692841 isoform X1 [Crassostrea gigas]
MCLAKNESSHFHQPVYLTASDPNCTCSLNGSVTRVKILQTISIELLIQSKDNNIFEHQYTGVNLYGDDTPVQADNLIIAIRNGSNASLTLIKVLGKGGFTISCDKNIPVRASSSLINRRDFKIEPTIGISFTKSKTSIFIESTTNDQVPLYKEKIESPKMATTDGGVLSWIQTILIIFLLLFAFLIYYKKGLKVIVQSK